MYSYLLYIALLSSLGAQAQFFTLSQEDWKGISLGYSISSYERLSVLYEAYKLFNTELNNPDYTDEYKTRVRSIKRKHVSMGVLQEVVMLMGMVFTSCVMNYGIRQWQTWRSKGTVYK